MVFTLDHMKSLLESNSVYELRNAESVICDRSKKFPRVTQTKPYESLTVTKTVKRGIRIERDVPDVIENEVSVSKLCLCFSQLIK